MTHLVRILGLPSWLFVLWMVWHMDLSSMVWWSLFGLVTIATAVVAVHHVGLVVERCIGKCRSRQEPRTNIGWPPIPNRLPPPPSPPLPREHMRQCTACGTLIVTTPETDRAADVEAVRLFGAASSHVRATCAIICDHCCRELSEAGLLSRMP